MDRRPTTSPLLQLIDALNRSVEPEHHTRIISTALHTAGLVDLPHARPDFREFVSGPLSDAIRDVAGEEQATEGRVGAATADELPRPELAGPEV